MVTRRMEVAAASAFPGVTRRVLAHDGALMAAEFSFEKGSVGALHSHPHEQIGYVVKGRFELELDGEKTTLEAGDSYHVPRGVPHGVVALESSVMLDIFTPQRKDFLPQG
jgi:quercetin dioxygenase-like cupin family protein